MIYLDNAATTKPINEVFELADKYLNVEYFNPSSLYRGAFSLQNELKVAKKNILATVADEGNFSLIFTASGTEADNQALFCGNRKGNIVTTFSEHSAVFYAANELKQRGVDVRFAKLKSDGSVDADSLISLIDNNTSLVSVIHVNNEMGSINDIVSISNRVKYINSNTLFHSDGVQAFGKIPFKLTKNIDMYSISAHKIGGVKGCGGLIIRKNLTLKPLIYGGGQESGLRSGTENIFAIKCFECATLKRYKFLFENYNKVLFLNKKMRSLLDCNLFEVLSADDSSPYILTVSARGVRGEMILHEADDNNLIIGTGSACSSNNKKRYSRVILACNRDEVTADGVFRLSFSPDNTEQDIIESSEILNRIVKNRKEKLL